MDGGDIVNKRRPMRVNEWVIRRTGGYDVGKIIAIFPSDNKTQRMAWVEWNGTRTSFHRTRDLRRVSTSYLP